MNDTWVPSPPQPPGPPPPDNLPPANAWAPTTPCAAPDSPSIVPSVIITGVPAIIASAAAGKYVWSITLNDGGTPPNFSVDHYDATGALIEHPIAIDGTSGDVLLTHDPTQPLGAATKHYADNNPNYVQEAPINNTTYGRDNGAWVALPATYIPEAPNTSTRFGRYNSIWQPDAIQTDAPSDGNAYARSNGAWTAAVTGGPYLSLSGGTMTGPLTMQGSNMIALNSPLASGQSAIIGQKAGINRWQMMIGDYTAEGLNNVGSNFSLVAFSTTGTTLGTWLTIARADGAVTFNGSGVTIQGGLAVNGTLALAGPGNLAMYGGTAGQVLATNGSGILSWATRLADAPSDGQFYTRQNAAWAVAPGGMTDAPNDGTAYARKSQAWAHLTHTDITDWTATLAPYALTTAVPVASTTTPTMNGTGAVGTGITWARADHVHPSDTSRYAASNPSGYQTAAQVTASLPVASSTTPAMNGTAAAGASAAWSRGDHVHPTDTSRAAQTSLANYLPLAGGTLTGDLNGVNATLSGQISGASLAVSGVMGSTSGYVNGPLQVNGTVSVATGDTSICATGTGAYITLNGAVSGPEGASLILNGGGRGGQSLMECYWGGSTMALFLDYSGNLTIAGSSATKASGTTWANPSDARIKTVVSDYALGLSEVMALRPVVYRYKGNDGAPGETSLTKALADAETPLVGLIAQEVETVFPGMVTKKEGWIDGVKVDDFRTLDTHELVFALVNAVKELSARVVELEKL